MHLFYNIKTLLTKKNPYAMTRILIFAFLLLLVSCKPKVESTDAAASTGADSTAVETPAVEFASPDLIAAPKAGLAALTSGDIDAFVANYAENAMYRWNNGDSLSGKKAIYDYWKNRRTNAIKTIEFSNDIWLPVKVNTPANQYQAPGNWVLSWYRTNATYTTGKSMTQWIHTDYHINNEGKIDLVIQYLDRAPINAAMTK